MQPLSPNLKSALSIAGAVGVLTAAYLGFVQIIDTRIENKLRNSELERSIVREVNRYVVIDGTGSVIADPYNVFDEWIENISLTSKDPTAGPMSDAWLSIKLKKYSTTGPIVSKLEGNARCIPERVSSLEWRCELIALVVTGPYQPLHSKESRYLVHIYR